MFTFIRFFIYTALTLIGLFPSQAEAQFSGGSYQRSTPCRAILETPIHMDLILSVGQCDSSGYVTGQQRVVGNIENNNSEFTIESNFTRGRPNGYTIMTSNIGVTFTGDMFPDGRANGYSVSPGGMKYQGEFLEGRLWAGILTTEPSRGSQRIFYVRNRIVSEAVYHQTPKAALPQATNSYAYTLPSTASVTARPQTSAPAYQAVQKEKQSLGTEICTAYTPFPRHFEGIPFQYQGTCQNGIANGQLTVQSVWNSNQITITSNFRYGSASGATTVSTSNNLYFTGTIINGLVTGSVRFEDGRVEQGTWTSGQVVTGSKTASNGITKQFFVDGREVNRGANQQAQASPKPAERPNYSYTQPVPTQAAATTINPTRTPAPRRRSLNADECVITPPPELLDARTSTDGECEGGLFTGKVTFTLAADTTQGLETRYIVPFRRGRPSGPMSAAFPSIGGVFKGSFNGISPDYGTIEIPLGNNVYQIAELRGGTWVSERTERREPGFMEQLVGAILYQYVIPAVQQRIRQEMINGLQELRDRPARRARYAEIQAGETRQREYAQAQERQNNENIRLANEANERRVAAQAQAESERQARLASDEAARQVRLQAEAKAYADMQAANAREYAERQAQNQREQAERQAQNEREQAERDAAARQRQMAQNTFSVTTQPPEFGGSTAAPVVTTNPPEGVPAPIVGTNPPSEVPPPLQSGRDLSPTIRQPDVPPPLPSGTSQPDLRPTFGTPNVPPPLDSGRGLEPTLGPSVPVPPPTTGPTPLPSGQDLRPSFPSQPAQPVQAPTRNDTLGSGSANSQPTPTQTQTTRPITQQVSSPSVPNTPTGLYPTATGELAQPIPLGWSAVARATRYRITVKDTFANTFPVDDQFVTTNQYTVQGLGAGRTFTWDVAACNQAGCSARSQNGVFRTGVIRDALPIGDALMQCLMAENGRRLPTGDRASSFAFTLIANAKTARAQLGKELYFERLKWYFSLVRNRGSWDYKQRGSNYENFGNFHFGFVGAAAEIPDAMLLRLAGWAQRNAGTSDPNWDNFLGAAPYGDDPNDQHYIRLGVSLYRLCQRNF